MYAKPPFGSAENMLEYLGRYTYKIAISNYRILAIDKVNKTVTFSMKEYRNQGKKTTLTLSTKAFIKRFQNHILTKGFTRIRHYGYLSSSWKKEKLPTLQLILSDKELDTIAVFIPIETSLPSTCVSCKIGKLITILVFGIKSPPKNSKTIEKEKKKKKTN